MDRMLMVLRRPSVNLLKNVKYFSSICYEFSSKEPSEHLKLD
jgi:hypothetical protein